MRPFLNLKSVNLKSVNLKRNAADTSAKIDGDLIIRDLHFAGPDPTILPLRQSVTTQPREFVAIIRGKASGAKHFFGQGKCTQLSIGGQGYLTPAESEECRAVSIESFHRDLYIS